MQDFYNQGYQQFNPQQNSGGFSQGIPQSFGNSGFVNAASDQVYTPAFQMENAKENRANLQGVSDQYGGLLDLLNAQARGDGPSVAENQLRQSTDRNIAQSMALGASQAGFQPSAATQRAILNQTGQMNQQAAMDNSILRAQEMLAGRQSLSDALGQQAGVYGAMSGLDAQQTQNDIALQQLLSGNFQNQTGLQTQERIGMAANAQAAAAADKSLIGSIFSDVRLKENIVESEPDLHEFLDSLGGE